MTDIVRTELARLEVRRADKDLPSFIDLIAQTLLDDADQVVDLSQHTEHGNRIPLHTCHLVPVEKV
ncbi:MAG TPA: hypothetical protein VGX23_18830 [Actinocrinis sp.]|nr:hypothetical protein [Actinocrinis sp.]